VARVGAYTLTGTALAAVIALATLAIGIPLLAGQSGPDLAGGDYAKLVAGGVLVSALAVAIGVAFGTLVRNQVFAVIGLLVWVTILEPLVGLIKDRLLDYTLGSALTGVAEAGSDRLSFGGAILVLLAWTVAMLAAAALVDGRRDVE
jgi:hypothetical protein